VSTKKSTGNVQRMSSKEDSEERCRESGGKWEESVRIGSREVHAE